MKDKFYYKDGSVLDYFDYNKILHREDGPAVERWTGTKEWYIDDKFHRVDGPATKEWYIDDKLHREDGPAVEWSNGCKNWWIDDEYYTEEEFIKLMNEINNMPKELQLVDPRWWVREIGKQNKEKQKKDSNILRR